MNANVPDDEKDYLEARTRFFDHRGTETTRFATPGNAECARIKSLDSEREGVNIADRMPRVQDAHNNFVFPVERLKPSVLQGEGLRRDIRSETTWDAKMYTPRSNGTFVPVRGFWLS